jgi:hypothetical protein
MDARRLRELIYYEPASGEFFTKGMKPISFVRKSNGRRYIALDGQKRIASRIAWLWMRGILPPFQIAHRNGDNSDDRWINLKPVSDTRVFKSVRYESEGQYLAQICVMGKLHFLGYFKDPKTAHAAVRQAMKNHLQYVPSKVLKKWANEPRFG